MKIREATGADALAIAKLHADSWRAHYRGAYRDDYLDGDVVADRRKVWTNQLSAPPENQYVILAEENGELVGFACAFGADDPVWGTLLDNIHVQTNRQRSGIGAALLAQIAAWCRQHYPHCGLYLWVLAENDRAQKFYKSLGAVDRGGAFSEPPGGGEIHGRRYVWDALPDLPRHDLS